MIKDDGLDFGSTSLVVVLNWAEEMKRAIQAPTQ
jgi:hypothetical protein